MQDRNTCGWLLPAAACVALTPIEVDASGFELLEQSASAQVGYRF